MTKGAGRGRREETGRLAKPGPRTEARRPGGSKAIWTHLAAGAVGLIVGLPIGLVVAGSGESTGPSPVEAAEGDGPGRTTLPPPVAGVAEERILAVRVKDGDTLVVPRPDNPVKPEETIRFLGIDTPEMFKDFYAQEAYEKARDMVEGKEVRLVYDVIRTGDMGRTLAYVYLEDTCINLELLRGGYARLSDHSTTKLIARYADFKAAEEEARRAGRGLWDDRARQNWETDFLAEEWYACSDKTVHRPGCRHVPEAPIRIGSLDEAMVKRKGCGFCKPHRNHPVHGNEE